MLQIILFDTSIYLLVVQYLTFSLIHFQTKYNNCNWKLFWQFNNVTWYVQHFATSIFTVFIIYKDLFMEGSAVYLSIGNLIITVNFILVIDDSLSTEQIISIAGGSSGVLLLVIIIIVVLVFVRRNRRWVHILLVCRTLFILKKYNYITYGFKNLNPFRNIETYII